MGSAVRSNAIVSSLFPSNVRDRIHHQETGVAVLDQQQNNKLADAVNAMEAQQKPEQQQSLSLIDNSPPIADLYPNTTVMCTLRSCSLCMCFVQCLSLSPIVGCTYVQSRTLPALRPGAPSGHRLKSLCYWKRCTELSIRYVRLLHAGYILVSIDPNIRDSHVTYFFSLHYAGRETIWRVQGRDHW